MKKVLVIVGPTAVGKTALGVHLAQVFNGEVISGDSMQIYRQLDIGTAKVTPEEAQGVPHHLIDIRDFTESYSVAEFQQAARQLIEEIHAAGKLPIIVGGTGLYIQALLYDYQLGGPEEVTTDPLQQEYEDFALTNGKEALWGLLKEKDPAAAEKIHWNNQRKVIRALVVLARTGHSILQPEETPQALYDYLMIGLDTERHVLYQRIETRVEQMMTAGLVEEAALLREHEETQAAKGIGYREFFPYFKGEADLSAVTAAIKQDSRRYAKRQLTWFRNRLRPVWFDLVAAPQQLAEIEILVKKWMKE